MNDRKAAAGQVRVNQAPFNVVMFPSAIESSTERASTEIIEMAAGALRDAGFPVRGRTFPFSMHHAFYRERIQRTANGRHLRHAEVAALLRGWAATRELPGDYAWQAVEGAVRRMTMRDPDLAERIPRPVRDGMTGVDDGASFLAWARRSLIG